MGTEPPSAPVVRRSRISAHAGAFTVIELLIGMVVTSITLSAVATFAFALTVGSLASGDAAATQAQVRQATLRLCDLVGGCKLLCAAPGNDLVVWRADDNADNQINLNELVYLERGDDCSFLRLCQFASTDNPPVSLSDLALGTTKPQFQAQGNPVYASLIPRGTDVRFAFYPAVPSVTQATCLMVSFTVTENGSAHRYEVVAALRGRAANLLNPAGNALVTTDDD
jgi:hypothetical protein